jgi:putative ABC transport system permease protein
VKVSDSIRRAGRSLKNAKGRTVLTSLAIAVGSFTLTLSLAAGQGAREYADNLISSNVDPQSIFIAKDPSLFGEGGGGFGGGGLKEYDAGATEFGGATLKSLDQKDISIVEGTDGVEKVMPTYLVRAEYVTFEVAGKTKYTSDITAYDSSVLAETAAGTLPELGSQIKDGTIVVPEAFAKTLKKTPKELIGTTVSLAIQRAPETPTEAEVQQALLSGGQAALESIFEGEQKVETFTITGVSADSVNSLSASSALFISATDAKKLSEYATQGTDQYQKYITATVKIKDAFDPEAVKQSFKTEFDKYDNGDHIIAKTAKDLQGLLFTIVNILQGIVIGFGVLALIASAFGIINTQYISVLERTREIGLMKALGMRGRHVSRLFQLEAAWIGFLGGVLGAALAFGLGTLLNPWISDTIGLGDQYLLIFQPLPIAALIVALMLLAMVAGLLPARKAAKLDPIEALRAE